jgi:hypothetical protein
MHNKMSWHVDVGSYRDLEDTLVCSKISFRGGPTPMATCRALAQYYSTKVLQKKRQICY